jgi:tRNA modification GTPase
VGKSTLLNALTDQEHALVDHDPGTTRDVVTARVDRGGVVFVLHDTAGLRGDAGRVEEMGIARTLKEIDKADIVLALHEAGADDAVDTFLATNGVVLRVATKVDKMGGPGAAPLAGKNIVLTSSKNRTGLGELWEALEALAIRFRLREAASLGAFLNERHRHKLSLCREELNTLLAELSIEQITPPAEVVGTQLGLILAHLGEISGRVFSERVLDEVFQRFCVGK